MKKRRSGVQMIFSGWIAVTGEEFQRNILLAIKAEPVSVQSGLTDQLLQIALFVTIEDDAQFVPGHVIQFVRRVLDELRSIGALEKE